MNVCGEYPRILAPVLASPPIRGASAVANEWRKPVRCEIEGRARVRVLHAPSGDHDLVIELLMPRHESFVWDPRTILELFEVRPPAAPTTRGLLCGASASVPSARLLGSEAERNRTVDVTGKVRTSDRGFQVAAIVSDVKPRRLGPVSVTSLKAS